jgi:hypothetical protein
MRIDEISFSKPWNLISGTNNCYFIQSKIRDHVPRGLIQVWEKEKESSTEDTNIIATFESNGAWEVHHIRIDSRGIIHSGRKNQVLADRSANIGFISTAKKIYEDHLSRGRSIRVSSSLELWHNYEKFIDRIIRDTKYNVEKKKFNPNAVSFDGSPCVSQIIEPRGKFLNGTTINLT